MAQGQAPEAQKVKNWAYIGQSRARCDKLAGDGAASSHDQHVGMYASQNNWHTCTKLYCLVTESHKCK